MWNGFSNALGQAFEIVGTVVVFTLLGLWLDSRFGTRPIFTVVLMLLAVVGLGVIAYYRYKDQIRREEEGKPWTRNQK
jgi:F0F1-type ATP synthase assembly protein I